MDPKRKIHELEKERRDLLVLIDTLQTNLRSVSSYLNEKELKEINTRSYQWCLNWRNEE